MNAVADPARLPACDVLAFGPHPDDVEIACAGTLLRLVRAGRSVALVDLTRGEAGSRGTVSDRDAEAAAAGKALGAVARCNLGLPDTGVRVDDGATDLVVAALRAARPRLVLAPHERDVHPDHTAGAQLVRRATFLAGLAKHRPALGAPHRPRVVLHYPGNQPVEPTLVVDVSDLLDAKAAVVRCYRSQLDRPDDDPTSRAHFVQGLDLLGRADVRQRAYGARIAVVAGEGFWHDGPLPVGALDWLLG